MAPSPTVQGPLLGFASLKRFVGLAALAACAFDACAIGLRAAAGQVVIGQPIRLAIGIEGETDRLTDAGCFRLQTPPSTDGEFVLREASLSLDREGGRARLIVTSRKAWYHPVVEFRIVAACGPGEIVRDYTLLADLPTEPLMSAAPRLEVRSEERLVSAMPAPVVPKPAPAPRIAPAANPSPSGETSLTLTTDTDANALARRRYPNDREARDAFRARLAAANPDIFAGRGPIGSVPLPAGTVLKVPPDPEGMPEPTDRKPEAQSQRPAADKPRAKADRLVIGAGGDDMRKMPAGEMSATLERLDRMSEDQGRTQVRMMDNLAALEQAVAKLAQSLVQMETRMKSIDAERSSMEAERMQALAQLAQERARFGVLEILLLILASGGVGAGLIYYHDRLRSRHQAASGAETVGVAAVTPPPVPFSSTPFANLQDEVEAGGEASPLVSNRPAPAPLREEKGSRPPPPPAPRQPQYEFLTEPVRGKPATQAVQRPRAPVQSPVVTPPPIAPPAPPVHEFSPPEPPAPIPDIDIRFEEVPAGVPTLETPDFPSAEIPALPEDTFQAVAVEASPLDENVIDFEPAFEKDTDEVALKAIDTTTLDLDLDAPDSQPAGFPPIPRMLKVGDDKHGPSLSHETQSITDTVMEVTDVMMSIGFSRGAADILIDGIRENPGDGAQMWLRFLDIYLAGTLGEDFKTDYDELKPQFNVNVREWQGDTIDGRSLLDFPHIIEQLDRLWHTDDCDAYLMLLLSDTRGGIRGGFPRGVFEEIILLRRMFQGTHRNTEMVTA